MAHAWRDRDLSWLDFNRRVLHEALDERTPLLERLKFLAIFTSNLDEFYMKRVGLLSLKRLAEVREKVLDQLERQARCYRDLAPRLAEHGIFLVEWEQLTDAQREAAGELFDHNVSPALTPLGMDPAHPFPFMSHLSTHWGLSLVHI